MGFSGRWTELIMHCVTTVQYQIAHGGREFGSIYPSRGLRQGDPLSPYLFILCAEGLSALIRRAESLGRLKGCRVSNGAPRVSHMFFADDSYIFCRANEGEAQRVLDLLGVFQGASGQKINLSKSSIFFSKNTEEYLRRRVCARMQVEEANCHSTYLGLPNIIGRNKSAIFGFLKEKVRTRVQNWDAKLLSRAGKEVLLKTVAQAMPNYAMSVFLLPLRTCEDMENLMCKFWWRGSAKKKRGIHWMNWPRLCTNKMKGGMGFRCLREFNVALLGKQGWRLLTQPNSLVSRIFRARYFPNGTFLTAQLGSNPSFIWRSILEAQSLVRQGARWRICSGKDVYVLNEPWLLRDDNLFITSNHPALTNCKVFNLMITGRREWDRDLLFDLLEPNDAEAVLSIPLSLEEGSDNRYWKFEKAGHFSVKSAYRQLREEAEGAGEVENFKLWKWLWALSIPPKAKNFLWRACAECLPTNVLLWSKHVDVNPLCPWCHEDGESIVHCLVTCSFASACWEASGLLHGGIVRGDFAAWLLSLFHQLDSTQRAEAAMLCWGIWRMRNELVWNQRGCEVSDVRALSTSELDHWKRAQDRGNVISLIAPLEGDGNERWCTPDPGTIKVNVDAALFSESNTFSWGGVARDSHGAVVEAVVSGRAGPVSAGVAEAIGVREALSWIKQIGWSRVELETDCLVVVQSVRSAVEMPSYFGGVISDCRFLLRELGCVSLTFVKRSANRVAHNIARGHSIISDRVFVAGSIPSDVQSFVLDDLN